MNKHIVVKGARENNLKNIDVVIPRDHITVITGVSGSGKSSLAFNVIYGEGQRLFLDSLSTHSKRYLDHVDKPKVDYVHGLSPVVAIEQKKGQLNPRSTVGTMTDLSNYIRLLYSTIGKAQCPYCTQQITIRSTNQIAERIQSLPYGTKVTVLAPVSKIFNEKYAYLFDGLRKQGFRKVRINGVVSDTGDLAGFQETADLQIEVIVDHVYAKQDYNKQLVLKLEEGLRVGEGFIKLEIDSDAVTEKQRDLFYEGFACRDHHITIGDLEPKYFSANDPVSCCSTCGGMGTYLKAAEVLAVDNDKKSIGEGALTNTLLSVKHPYKYMLLYSLSVQYGFSMDTPFKDLPREAKDIIFYGTNGLTFELVSPPNMKTPHPNVGDIVEFDGILNQLDQMYAQSRRNKVNGSVQEMIFKKHMVEQLCPDCLGTCLKPQRLLVKIKEYSIHQLGELPLESLEGVFKELEIAAAKRNVATAILEEIMKRIQILNDIGLGYLSLNRRSDSLSGGECQRIRLSTQVGTGLMGMLYIMDEPSIGLHPKDNYRIIGMMKRLRDIGNTVIVVEHDLETIKEADHIIEIGPGPGIYGGSIIAQGNIQELTNHSESITGQYISGIRYVTGNGERRSGNGKNLCVWGARENNLKNVNVQIPLGMFVCVTGVSGSGKSTLVHEIVYKRLHSNVNPHIIPGAHDSIEGMEHINHVIHIDQTPIGRTANSSPATYMGIFDRIRQLFAETEEGNAAGYNPFDFSFTQTGSGRCDECNGQGTLTTELQFMPDVVVTCPSCKGARYKEEILEITYNGKNISEVLALSVDEAIDFFESVSYIHHKLMVMSELGLGYLRLGQSSATVSGGEAQRIKLAAELGKIKKGASNLYILDEPTTGLHIADIQKLLQCINRLVDLGHTVLVIEHNLDVIKTADYIIDIGPGAGKNGGMVVGCGTPEEIAKISESHTGVYLNEVLK